MVPYFHCNLDLHARLENNIQKGMLHSSTEYHSATCHSAECRCATCHYATCHSATCHSATCHSAECRCAIENTCNLNIILRSNKIILYKSELFLSQNQSSTVSRLNFHKFLFFIPQKGF
jgi:hypothetical protein